MPCVSRTHQHWGAIVNKNFGLHRHYTHVRDYHGQHFADALLRDGQLPSSSATWPGSFAQPAAASSSASASASVVHYGNDWSLAEMYVDAGYPENVAHMIEYHMERARGQHFYDSDDDDDYHPPAQYRYDSADEDPYASYQAADPPPATRRRGRRGGRRQRAAAAAAAVALAAAAEPATPSSSSSVTYVGSRGQGKRRRQRR